MPDCECDERRQSSLGLCHSSFTPTRGACFLADPKRNGGAAPVVAARSTLPLSVLGNVALAAMLSNGSAAPDEDAPTVAVLPIVVEGELPDIWRAKAGDRLATGLRRGALTVSTIAATGCTQWECAGAEARVAGADFAVLAKLTVASGGRDYSLSINAVGADTQNAVASLEGTCELCGYEEAVAMVEAKAAALSTALERLGGHPIVAFAGTPDRVEVSIDGEPVGATPLEIPLAPGPHDARLSKAGYLPQTISVAAVEGVRKELTFALVQAPTQTNPEPVRDAAPNRSRGLLIAGGVLTGLGVAAVGGGAVLLALHDKPYTRDCMADPDGDCRQLYRTLSGGAVATAVGSALLGSGVALLIVGVTRRKGGRARARLRVAPGGLAVVF